MNNCNSEELVSLKINNKDGNGYSCSDYYWEDVIDILKSEEDLKSKAEKLYIDKLQSILKILGHFFVNIGVYKDVEGERTVSWNDEHLKRVKEIFDALNKKIINKNGEPHKLIILGMKRPIF